MVKSRAIGVYVLFKLVYYIVKVYSPRRGVDSHRTLCIKNKGASRWGNAFFIEESSTI